MWDRVDMAKWKKVLAVGVLIIAVACIGGMMLKNQKREPVKVTLKHDGEDMQLKLETEVKSEESEEKAEQKIMVDVKGKVNTPGVYELKEGQRVKDAIEMAGGILDKADVSGVNLAAKLIDAQVVYIPEKGEKIPNTLLEYKSSGKININTAGKEALVQLPGIGEVIAKDIIDYRDKHKGFDSIDEITNVPRIGEKTFEKIKDLIEVR